MDVLPKIRTYELFEMAYIDGCHDNTALRNSMNVLIIQSLRCYQHVAVQFFGIGS